MSLNPIAQQIYHSGVTVDLTDCFFVFDYYRNPAGSSQDFASQFAGKNEVFVFVSHHHFDHFNREIFDWQKYTSRIHYILSSDINLKQKQDNYYFMKKGEKLRIKDITVNTLGSTGEKPLINRDSEQITLKISENRVKQT